MWIEHFIHMENYKLILSVLISTVSLACGGIVEDEHPPPEETPIEGLAGATSIGGQPAEPELEDSCEPVVIVVEEGQTIFVSGYYMRDMPGPQRYRKETIEGPVTVTIWPQLKCESWSILYSN